MTAVCGVFMDLQQSIYQSPKRKRGPEVSSPRLVTSGFRRLSDASDSVEAQSPSSRMTGKLQKLQLQSPFEGRLLFQGVQNVSQPQKEQATVPVASSLPSTSQSITPPQVSKFTFKSVSDVNKPEITRAGSPAPSDVASDQFWQASEITGWSPGDPDEDNYGINGVGYQKTPAIAHSLSQKRKQQIAEYRSRETREARQKRGERRLNARLSSSPRRLPSPQSTGESAMNKKVARIVRFEDG